MIVALYQDHHQLPWWGGSTNPFDVFDPERHKSLPFKGRAASSRVGHFKIIPLAEVKEIFSFLSGLHNVEACHLMAHVSALCSCELKEEGWWHFPKRFWVQISTLPDEFTDGGVPVVYDMVGKRNPEIHLVWGGDNGTYSPYSFFQEEKLQELAINDSNIWTRFFVEQLDLDPKLKAAKDDLRSAEELLNEARKAVSTIQFFGPDKLNQRINQKFNVC